MICSACQYANEEDALFCEQCGQALERRCPACGTAARPQARFCRKCGHSLTQPDVASPSATLPSLSLPDTRSLDDKLDRLQRYLPSHLSEKILASRGRLAGERKIVTVLFADIAGYTTLCEQLGEEVMFAVMDELYELCIHEVHRYEGTVNELTGDGVVAFFGAPLAVEQAPQRAVRAALALQREVARYDAGFAPQYGRQLQVRVGINTGPVIVGTVGNNLRMDYKAVGDTVNLAARMEQTAEPGAIQITEYTYKLVAGYFRCDDLGRLDIKGKADKVRAYRVTAERGTRARIDVERERGFTRFTGRERELELLHDAFARASEGRGQAMSLVGEAGLGKSRLLHEFRHALAGAELTLLEGRCSPYGATTAYMPIVEILKQNFHIEAHDGEADIVRKVEAGLQRVGGDLESTAPYVLRLLLGDHASSTTAALPPEVVKRRTFEALQRLMVQGAARRPLVLTFEDLHWADKTTEECATFLLDHIAGARVLLLFTHRPEFVSAWSRKSYHSTITLMRLLRRECHEMLMALLGSAEIQEALVELVIEKSEGVPFFLEELVQALRETGAMTQRAGQWRLTADAATVQVPTTIHDVLMARIDRLSEGAKRVLQIGSVIGREFPWALLQAVAGLPEPELRAHLAALTDAELIYERSLPSQVTYLFKHALTQDVAYDSLLLRSRRQLHQQIGETILAQHGGDLEEWTSVLAHHFRHSGDAAKALPYLVQTGERAERIYANVEAVRAFAQALEMLDTLPATDVTHRQRVELSLRLGSLHALLGHYHESLPFFRQALELAEATGDPKAIAHLETRIARVRHSTGDHEGAIADLQRALQLSQRIPDHTRMAICHQILGNIYFSSGRLPAAIESFMSALNISAQESNQEGIAVASTLLSDAHARAGNLAEAMQWGRKALALSEHLHDDRRVAWACIMLAQAEILAGELAGIAPLAEKAQELFDRVGDFRGKVWARYAYAERATHERDFAGALEYYNVVIHLYKEVRARRHELSFNLGRAAEMLLRLGRYREAFEYCQEGLAIALETSNKLEYGYAYMVLAEIHASEEYRDWDKSAWCLDESLKAFREVGAKVDVGRAHLTGVRIALLRGDGTARRWAETAGDIFAEHGAKALLKEAEELLAGIE